MSIAEIRQKLFDYIRAADDKKLKAIYTIIENETLLEEDVWTEDFIKEMNKRISDLENGLVTGLSWEELKQKALSLPTRDK